MYNLGLLFENMKPPLKISFLSSLCDDESNVFALQAFFGTRRLSSKKPVIKVFRLIYQIWEIASTIKLIFFLVDDWQDKFYFEMDILHEWTVWRKRRSS